VRHADHTPEVTQNRPARTNLASAFADSPSSNRDGAGALTSTEQRDNETGGGAAGAESIVTGSTTLFRELTEWRPSWH